MAACGPQPGLEPTQVTYKITPQNSGFKIEITHNGRYSNQQSYFITPSLKDPRSPVTHLVFQKGYFQMAGSDFLKCTGIDPTHKKSIRITWDAPSGWKFASSFSEQTFEASCYDLMDALYVGGNDSKLTIRKTKFGILAVMGSYEHLQISDFEDALRTNMTRVLEFWKSKPAPYHLVSIRSFGNPQKKYSGSGSAHFQSFQLDLPTNQKNDQTLDHLITHEYFHEWNPKKYNVPRAADSIEHVDILWFTEGFTDYFAYWLVYRNSRSDYIQTFQNENFRNIFMHELKRNYQNNHTYFSVPYIQGRRIAADIDKKINRYSGKRLENVMHELVERSQNPAFILTRGNIVRVLCEGSYMPCNQARGLIETYVIEGAQLKNVTNPLI